MNKERVNYYNYLRAVSTVAVVVIHLSAWFFDGVDVKSSRWDFINLFEALVRWAVPVFIMISGAVFLSREISTRVIYRKYILRLVIAYVVWSAFYAFVFPIGKAIVFDGFVPEWNVIMSNFIGGWYHMWFIPMIIGIYMCYPLIKMIIKSGEGTKYFLVLSFVFAILIPWLIDLLTCFAGENVVEYVYMFSGVLYNMNMSMVMGTTFFFVLGWWISNTEFNKRQRNIIYMLGIVGFILTVLLSAAAARKTLESFPFYGYLTLNVALEAAAVFTWFKYRKLDNTRQNAFVSKLAEYSFGAYLAHAFVISVLKVIGIDTGSIHPLLSIPVFTLGVAAVSFVVSFVLNKIPVVNKWLV